MEFCKPFWYVATAVHHSCHAVVLEALTGPISAELKLQDDFYLSHMTECCSAASSQGEASKHSETPEMAFHYGDACT